MQIRGHTTLLEEYVNRKFQFRWRYQKVAIFFVDFLLIFSPDINKFNIIARFSAAFVRKK